MTQTADILLQAMIAIATFSFLVFPTAVQDTASDGNHATNQSAKIDAVP